ncbi:hypothetical protein B4U79_17568 [Dinothrombium tinctorium]|uniref:Sushi domain-containing protein n=1 Tax=Dinothrombium tinctorium TaxID=1965070 RepID=A0A3S3NXD0_9ACAR|nr:hypothetical protein B4U79_17568 [Dinothrombium tinctorium]
MLLLCIACITLIVSVESKCGIPLVAEGVSHFPAKTVYSEGEIVNQFCANTTHELVPLHPKYSITEFDGRKAVQINCVSGKWKGNFPRCAIPISRLEESETNGKESMINGLSYYNATINEEDFLAETYKEIVGIEETQYSLPGNAHCIEKPSMPAKNAKLIKGYSWIINLKHKSTVAYISIKFTRHELGEELLSYDKPFVTAFVNQIRNCSVHQASKFLDVRGGTIDLLCQLNNPEDYDSNADAIETLMLQFHHPNYKNDLYIDSICLWDFPKACGTPEIPLDSPADGVFDTLLETPLVTCDMPTNDTHLKGNTFELSPGETVSYVNAKYYQQTLYAVPYTIEIHTCDDSVLGNRVCQVDGQWDTEELSCG